jgi:LPS O-antigen subunit length determinant protein (WzzB/FepE family)
MMAVKAAIQSLTGAARIANAWGITTNPAKSTRDERAAKPTMLRRAGDREIAAAVDDQYAAGNNRTAIHSMLIAASVGVPSIAH